MIYYEDSLRHSNSAVNSIGEILLDSAYLHRSVNDLTIYNDAYWAALAAIEKGDGLIILSKICMHIAKGEFDVAKRYLDIAQVFSEQNSMALSIYKQLDLRMGYLFEAIKKELRKGKAFQISGDFKRADLFYTQLLKILPNSAALNSEYFFVKSLLLRDGAPEEIIQLWKDCRKKVYACDPMFNMNAPALNSTDMYSMSKRHEVNLLFINQVRPLAPILFLSDLGIFINSLIFITKVSTSSAGIK